MPMAYYVFMLASFFTVFERKAASGNILKDLETLRAKHQQLKEALDPMANDNSMCVQLIKNHYEELRDVITICDLFASDNKQYPRGSNLAQKKKTCLNDLKSQPIVIDREVALLAAGCNDDELNSEMPTGEEESSEVSDI